MDPFASLPMMVVRVGATNSDDGRRTTMFRDHMFNFLQASIIFLLMTNAISAAAAAYAIRMMRALVPGGAAAGLAVERKLEALFRRGG
jgi:hypothetical protein